LAIFDQLNAAMANDPTLNSSVAVRNEVAEALGVDASLHDHASDPSKNDEERQPIAKPLQAGKPEVVESTPQQ
jgi:hypothetical protein